MTLDTGSVTSVGSALATGAYASYAAYLARGQFKAAEPSRSGQTLLAAIIATAAWAALVLVAEITSSRQWAAAAHVGDVLRYALWFAYFLRILPLHGAGTAKVASAVAVSLVLAALGFALLGGSASHDQDASRAAIASSLALPVCGLLLLEQLVRILKSDSRWDVKPLLFGLIFVFVYDVYLFSEALLFGRFDADVLSTRTAIHALAVPFLLVTSRRGSDWISRLQVSRTAAFYSATLVLAGCYLLFMAGVGYYIRYFGGTWGRALQLGLLATALAILAVLVFSGAARSRLRVFVGKHFYSYRYDYREEWLRFTAMLSAKRSPQEMGELIVRGLAKMVECPGGSLWTRNGGDDRFSQTASWNTPQVPVGESLNSSLCDFLRSNGWVIDLDELRSSPRRYGNLALPTWLLGTKNAWLVVPLLVGDELLGFVVLARPLAPQQLNWEVLDLLKTAGRQAAGYLAQMQATEALLDARKFEAFNRMSAFVVHDLKNIVAQLSLMLKNAERLHDNKEFQQDMLLTVESSLEKMRRLMLQLREGATPPGGSRGVEMIGIVGKLVSLAKSQGRTLESDATERLATRGHDERLERVLGHLVQNALDATPATGRVWVKCSRYSGQIKVEVGDTGAGMTEEFIRTRLFRPFNTTKRNGMGIGTYESFQYIRELGGSIAVDSTPGQGTTITVLLPLFELSHGSDLLGSGTL